jgi:hypothetical protein
MLGFIRLISAKSWSETQHFKGHITFSDPFNPTYRNVELRLIDASIRYSVIVNTPPSLRPNVSGKYIW